MRGSFLKTHKAIALIALLGMLFRLYRLEELMPFIGDHAWFYLSASDMLLTGKIPLVGITSSHTWLHQGPLWTYLLSLALLLGKFHPLAGGYLAVLIGVTTLFFIYKVGSVLFTKRVGVIAAFLFSISPLAIIHARTPYHTNPIPLLVLFFMYSFYKWVRGGVLFFPLVLASCGLLYNFELATVVLWIFTGLFFLYGLWQKKQFALRTLRKKTLLLSLFALLVPMLPIIVYDLTHDFSQTGKFIIWVGYQAISFFGFIGKNAFSFPKTIETLQFFSLHLKRLVFIPQETVSVVLFLASFTFLTKRAVSFLRKREVESAHVLTFLLFMIAFLALIVNQTPSEAHLLVFFPLIVFSIALFFDRLFRAPRTFVPALIAIFLLAIGNIFFLLRDDYLMGKPVGYGPTFAERKRVAKAIVETADGFAYNLVGKGEGSQFASFTANYEYLTWWLGHAPAKKGATLRFIVEEKGGKIFLGRQP